MTEFHIGDSDWTNPHVIAETRKTIFGKELGEEIASKFKWECPVKNNPTRFKLEIEAFPMDKWVEFKEKLTFYLQECEDKDQLPETLWVIRMIKQLESFGKPSGDAIANQQSNNE